MQLTRFPGRSCVKASLILALGGLLGPVSGAVAAPTRAVQETSKATSTEDTGSKEATRLLHLRNGQVLRVRSRLAGRRWEIRRGKEWSALPVEYVTRVTLERNILREARKRAKRIDKDDLAARVAHARWLWDEGLVTETSKELAEVLARDPEQTEALNLLKERPLPLSMPRLGTAEPGGLPENLDEFLRFCAGASPLGRELATQKLARTDEREALRTRFKQELFNRSPRRRAFAAFTCRRLFPGEFLRELVHRAVVDASATVRHEAALALRDAHEPAVIVPVIRALSSAHPRVRDYAAGSLGTMGYASAVQPMVTALVAMTSAPQSGGAIPTPRAYFFTGKQTAYIQDFDVEVAQFQAVADPQVNVLLEGSVLEARIQGTTSKAFTTTRTHLRKSLSKLTNVNPGRSTRAWTKWWNENAETWSTAAQIGRDREAR